MQGERMNPTIKLRFVERVVNDIKVRILQQWWEDNQKCDIYRANGSPGEWRDIPLEKEA